jgi:hypothetical protein
VLFQPSPGRTDIASFLVFVEGDRGDPVLVCYAPDPADTRERLSRLGMDVSDPRPVSPRVWVDPVSGQALPVDAEQLVIPDATVPLRVNGFRTTTLSTYHHPPFTTHANGATRILGVTCVASDLPAAAEWLGTSIFGAPVRWRDDDCAVLIPRDLFIRLVTPAGLRTRYPGLPDRAYDSGGCVRAVHVAVPDPGEIRDRAAAAGIDHRTTPHDQVLVTLDPAVPVVLQFERFAPVFVQGGTNDLPVG